MPRTDGSTSLAPVAVAAHEQLAPGQAEQPEHGDEQVERGAVAGAQHVGEGLLADPALRAGGGEQHRQVQPGAAAGVATTPAPRLPHQPVDGGARPGRAAR